MTLIIIKIVIIEKIVKRFIEKKLKNFDTSDKIGKIESVRAVNRCNII